MRWAPSRLGDRGAYRSSRKSRLGNPGRNPDNVAATGPSSRACARGTCAAAAARARAAGSAASATGARPTLRRACGCSRRATRSRACARCARRSGPRGRACAAHCGRAVTAASSEQEGTERRHQQQPTDSRIPGNGITSPQVSAPLPKPGSGAHSLLSEVADSEACSPARFCSPHARTLRKGR